MRIKAIEGLPIIDSIAPLTLKITKGDIARASPQEPNRCAIARACRRQLHVLEARIHLSRTYLRTNAHNWVRYVTPAAARAEIIAFDRGGRFDPTEITLGAIPPNIRIGARHGGTKTGKGRKRQKPHIVTNVRGGPA